MMKFILLLAMFAIAATATARATPQCDGLDLYVRQAEGRLRWTHLLKRVVETGGGQPPSTLKTILKAPSVPGNTDGTSTKKSVHFAPEVKAAAAEPVNNAPESVPSDSEYRRKWKAEEAEAEARDRAGPYAEKYLNERARLRVQKSFKLKVADKWSGTTQKLKNIFY